MSVTYSTNGFDSVLVDIYWIGTYRLFYIKHSDLHLIKHMIETYKNLANTKIYRKKIRKNDKNENIEFLLFLNLRT